MEIDFIESGYYYHIFNRGINREIIFDDEWHYQKFLLLCKKYFEHHADVLAYCLLPTHFHFLLRINEHPDRVELPCQGKQSLFLSHLFNAYAQWFNKKTGRTGGLFQRPFKRKRIEDEKYLRHVIYYIHRNPLHHNLVNTPENWLYSSYRAILSPLPTLVKREEVIQWFEDEENFRYFHQKEFALYQEYSLED